MNLDLADLIRLGQKEPPLRFLVIGAHAVSSHGHTRFTEDVDFLAPKSDRSLWNTRVIEAGLTLFAEHGSFAQFEQKLETALETEPALETDAPLKMGTALDIMFVPDESFEELWRTRVEKPFDDANALVPSVDNVIALKLHVIKQKLPHRTSKDLEDVEMLVRRNKLDLGSSHYENLFLKYGSREIYETMQRILKY